MRILVIEDDSEAAAYLVKGLTESGHRVDLAEHGRTGLDIARRENFDAMIIDRMLPGLDGLSIIAALRAAKNLTPVLVLSALGDVEERVKGLRSGCDDYLSKPFAFSELLARLEELTRRSTAGPEITTKRIRRHFRKWKRCHGPTHGSVGIAVLEAPHQQRLDRRARDDAELTARRNGLRQAPAGDADAHAALDDRRPRGCRPHRRVGIGRGGCSSGVGGGSGRDALIVAERDCLRAAK